MDETQEQKLVKLLKEAIELLEEAIVADNEKNDKQLDLNVWKAASAVEYTLFLMSLNRASADDSWKIKKNKSTYAETDSLLAAAQNHLREAIGSIGSNVENAYRNAWIARDYILNIQKYFDKAKFKGQPTTLSFRPQRLL